MYQNAIKENEELVQVQVKDREASKFKVQPLTRCNQRFPKRRLSVYTPLR